MLSFKPAFSLSSFTFIKRFFSSSSLSAIRVLLSVYRRSLIFLLEILIPAYASSNPAQHLEKAMAPHSSTLAWKILWTEEPSGLQSKGSLRVGHDQVTSYFHFTLSCIGEGNGNPLQWSCLENPRDGGAWLPAVYGVSQSRIRLKRLSSSSSSRNLADRLLQKMGLGS